MIIKKPYAFLIKYFRKIHIALILLGLYVLYKTMRTVLFVNAFVSSRLYDPYKNPITHYIPSYFSIIVLIMALGSIAIMFLLHHKGKPWKLYLIPSILYTVLFFILGMIKSFFTVYTEIVDVGNLRLSNDLLMIMMILQVPTLAIFVMRVLGIDIKKFNFREDLNDLEISEEDKEEIEIGLNIDIYTFIRFFRKIKRYAGYFYEEHKYICRGIAIIIAFILLKNIYSFIFVENKVYREGQNYNVNGYTMKVEESYFTDKDGQGNIITKDSNFVITKIKLRNNIATRTLDASNFHIRAGNKDFKTTDDMYAKEFEDLGETYTRVRKIHKDEIITIIIVFKVDKKINKKRFNLYYQEKGGSNKLRKIKLKIKDVSKIEKEKTYKQGEFFEIDTAKIKDSVAFDSIEIDDEIQVTYNNCLLEDCILDYKTITAPNSYKIIAIDFASTDLESKNMIDFLSKYGKINYKDSRGKIQSIDIDFMIKSKYLGKTIYLKVPNNIAESEYISLNITTRNKKYNCIIT